jgi:hypothetical protein
MGWRYTFHAEERMTERHITKPEVEAVVNDPQTTEPGRREGTKVYRRTVDGRRLKIVVNEVDHVIISVMSPDE